MTESSDIGAERRDFRKLSDPDGFFGYAARNGGLIEECPTNGVFLWANVSVIYGALLIILPSLSHDFGMTHLIIFLRRNHVKSRLTVAAHVG